MPSKFAATLRHRDMRYVLGAYVVDDTASWGYTVVLAAYAYGRTGSTGWIALIACTRWIVGLLVSGYAGVLADRYDRARLIAASGVLCAVAMVGSHRSWSGPTDRCGCCPPCPPSTPRSAPPCARRRSARPRHRGRGRPDRGQRPLRGPRERRDRPGPGHRRVAAARRHTGHRDGDQRRQLRGVRGFVPERANALARRRSRLRREPDRAMDRRRARAGPHPGDHAVDRVPRHRRGGVRRVDRRVRPAVDQLRHRRRTATPTCSRPQRSAASSPRSSPNDCRPGRGSLRS